MNMRTLLDARQLGLLCVPVGCALLFLFLAGCIPAERAVASTQLMVQETARAGSHPTLADLWNNSAEFVVDVPDTGLPLGESETIVLRDGVFWSFIHASTQSAGVVDQCGDPVAFPGCTVRLTSVDGGQTFSYPGDGAPVCLFPCQSCPCTSERDHIDQQQYPDLFFDGGTLWLVYEYRGRTMLRTSSDGDTWSDPQRIGRTGVWREWLFDCPDSERIGPHPFEPPDYECLAGAPPGVFVTENTVYAFVGVGQNPGGMGCYRGPVKGERAFYQRCENNPLFRGAAEYGPVDLNGAAANPYFDFKTISSAELLPVDDGETTRLYLLYEGIRGPGPGDPGDTQFGLGLARTTTDAIDGPWEPYPHNPLLIDLPGNVGLGHADLVVHNGQTYLYTSLDGATRSRFVLGWR